MFIDVKSAIVPDLNAHGVQVLFRKVCIQGFPVGEVGLTERYQAVNLLFHVNRKISVLFKFT